ncbi:MAG: alcohol dehydrogenase catalytic domain-containing protein [Acidimicrobiia bacterium]|nr:alcohol dehydrogenase catalytic domain-containing protein [Acidimicrobiia bacterium]
MMSAAVLEQSGGPLLIRDVQVPVPGAGELLVEVEACGVCHTDLHLRDGEEEAVAYPLILGHEGIGRVVAFGRETSSLFRLGDRVGFGWIYDTCLDCEECRTGHETTCLAQRARGHGRDGAFAEYALVRESFAVPVNNDRDPVELAPWMCAGVTALAAIRKTELGPGTTCVIFGCGGLGLFAIGFAKQHGARVVAVDLSDAKLAGARANGADHLVLAGPQAGRGIRDLGGAEVFLNFAPSAAVWDTIIESANPRSSVVFVALTGDRIPLSMTWLIDGGHRLTGSSVGSRQDMRDALVLASRSAPLIDIERISLTDVNGALDRLKAGRIKGRAVVDFSAE